MSAPGFYLYTRDFRDGVRRLKDDEVGVYILLLTVLYETPNGRVRDNDIDIANDLGRDPRVWKRVKKRLLDLGKIVVRDGWLGNPKADIEIAKRQAVSEARSEAGREGGKASGKSRRARAKTDFPGTSGEDQPKMLDIFATSSADLPGKSDAKTNEINGEHEAFASLRARDSLTLALRDSTLPDARGARGLQDVLDAEFEERPRPPDPEPAAANAPDQPPTKPDHDLTVRELLEAACAAAGPGLTANKTILAGSAERIVNALAAGCSLEADVLPAIAARTAKARASPIETFAYFEAAWFERRDRRLASLSAAPETVNERSCTSQSRRVAAGEDRSRLARAARPVGAAGQAGGIVGAVLRRQAERARLDAERGAAGASGGAVVLEFAA